MRQSKFRDSLGRFRAKVDQRGRMVVPLEFRKALGLQDGEEIVMTWKDDELRLTKDLRDKRTTRGRGPR